MAKKQLNYSLIKDIANRKLGVFHANTLSKKQWIARVKHDKVKSVIATYAFLTEKEAQDFFNDNQNRQQNEISRAENKARTI